MSDNDQNLAKSILVILVLGIICCIVGAVLRGWAGFWAILIAVIMLCIIINSIANGRFGLFSILWWFFLFALLTLPIWYYGDGAIVLQLADGSQKAVSFDKDMKVGMDGVPSPEHPAKSGDLKVGMTAAVFVNGDRATEIIAASGNEPSITQIIENGPADLHGTVVKIQASVLFDDVFEVWRSIGRSFGWWSGLFYPCMGIGLGLLLIGISKLFGAK